MKHSLPIAFAVSAVGAAAGLSLLLTSASAHAAPEVVLEYRVPEPCPDRAHFVAQVADRGGHVQGARSAELVEQLTVSIEPSSEHAFVGTLLVKAPDGRATSREIHDPDCGEVVTGLAVVAAIALGAREGGAEPAPREETNLSATPTQARSSETSEPTEPVEKQPADATAPKLSLRGSSFGQPDAVEVEAGTLRFAHDRRLSLQGGVDYGLLPRVPMPRLDLSASFGEFVVTPTGSSHLVGPILQTRLTMYGPVSYGDGTSQTDALGFGGSIAACSALSYDDRGLSALACAEFGAGTMAVETTDADGSITKKNSGFGLAGLALDAEYGLGGLFYLAFAWAAVCRSAPSTRTSPADNRTPETSFSSAATRPRASGCISRATQ